MFVRNLLLTAAGALALTAGLHAQVCNQNAAAGTYVTNISGWALVPNVGMLPAVAQGVIRIDESGKITTIIPLTTVVGGMLQPMDTINAGTVTVGFDCSVNFKATCAGGCYWEGVGVFLKPAKEFNMVFTKTNGYPLTATAVFKLVSN